MTYFREEKTNSKLNSMTFFDISKFYMKLFAYYIMSNYENLNIFVDKCLDLANF